MKLLDGTIPVFGDHEPGTLRQLRDVASRAHRAALMADGHQGYVMPIGGVAAYHNAVSVVGVGVDIACGNAAILTDMVRADFPNAGRQREDFQAMADEIQRTISFGMQRPTNKNDDAPTDHPLFDDPAWGALPAQANAHNLKGQARAQLGTVGGGNHYVDVFADECDRIWVGVHFGSRGLGFKIAHGFLALGQGKLWHDKVPELETLLTLDSALGAAYWQAMSMCGAYAYAGREWVARKVTQILGAHELALVHNHHNFAWKETHSGEDLVVIRKGATPAFPGQQGFVGGSMGDNAVIIDGATPSDTATCYAQVSSMFSTVHGAGRVRGRMDCKKGTAVRDPETDKPTGVRLDNKITRDEMNAWVKERGVVVRGGDVDESPQAYRRLPAVLAEQGGTVNVLHTLRPLIVVMADSRTHDPFKD